MTEVAEQGDKVKVELTGTYAGTYGNNSHHLVQVSGTPGSWAMPAEAIVTVVEKMLPSEPDHGTIIRFSNGALFARTHYGYGKGVSTPSWTRLDRKDSPSDYVSSNSLFTWREVMNKFGAKFEVVDLKARDILADVKPFEKDEVVTIASCCGARKLNIRRVNSWSEFGVDASGELFANNDMRNLAKRILKTLGTG